MPRINREREAAERVKCAMAVRSRRLMGGRVCTLRASSVPTAGLVDIIVGLCI